MGEEIIKQPISLIKSWSVFILLNRLMYAIPMNEMKPFDDFHLWDKKNINKLVQFCLPFIS